MTKLLLPTLSILALALPAAAQAAPKKVDQSPESIRAYWTAERMENAKPKPAAKPGGAGGGGGATTAWTTFQPAWNGINTPAPIPTNGKVFFTEKGVNYVCSGTAASSTGENLVVTAGHCVNEGPGAYVTNWAFVPAYRDNQRPFGTWPASALGTTDGWRLHRDFGRDVGVATVTPPLGVSLEDTVGARHVAFEQLRSQPYSAHGYPASGKFNGARLWVSNTRWVRNDTSTEPDTMGIATDLNGGSSGGGWIAGAYDDPAAPLVSVNSYGYSSMKNTMFGPYFSGNTQDPDQVYDLLKSAGSVDTQ